MTNIEKTMEKDKEIRDPFDFMKFKCPDDYGLKALKHCRFKKREAVDMKQCLKCWLKEVKE